MKFPHTAETDNDTGMSKNKQILNRDVNAI